MSDAPNNLQMSEELCSSLMGIVENHPGGEEDSEWSEVQRLVVGLCCVKAEMILTLPYLSHHNNWTVILLHVPSDNLPKFIYSSRLCWKCNFANLLCCRVHRKCQLLSTVVSWSAVEIFNVFDQDFYSNIPRHQVFSPRHQVFSLDNIIHCAIMVLPVKIQTYYWWQFKFYHFSTDCWVATCT